ncbi:methyltransferase domain-containing protein [Candidatus Micrarchaeota archaeon]|nr:methyltransferase domain-containing protein [Candidatus Micrarchaeota archaeon]
MVDIVGYWKRQSQTTERIGEYTEEKVVGLVTRLLGLNPKKTLLDVGCATGKMLSRLRARRKTGVDYSEKYAKKARKKNPSAKIVVAEAAELPFKNASFDAVLCHSLMHLMDPAYAARVVGELERVCKKGGRIVIGDVPDPRTYPGGKWVYRLRTEALKAVNKPHYTMFSPAFFKEKGYAIVAGPVNDRYYAYKQKYSKPRK